MHDVFNKVLNFLLISCTAYPSQLDCPLRLTKLQRTYSQNWNGEQSFFSVLGVQPVTTVGRFQTAVFGHLLLSLLLMMSLLISQKMLPHLKLLPS